MDEFWDPSAPGILRLPSGKLVRGRGLSRPLPDGPHPAFGVYLLGQSPPDVPWESRWLRWPDFRLPADRANVLPTLTEAWQRAATERVEVACAGGRGRTGTALACMAILDGVPASRAVAFVREHYNRHAVETFRQRRYVARWPGRLSRGGPPPPELGPVPGHLQNGAQWHREWARRLRSNDRRLACK